MLRAQGVSRPFRHDIDRNICLKTIAFLLFLALPSLTCFLLGVTGEETALRTQFKLQTSLPTQSASAPASPPKLVRPLVSQPHAVTVGVLKAPSQAHAE